MNTSGEVLIGNDFWKLRNENVAQPVYWRERELSNHHVGVTGTSGSGKTHWIRQFITAMPNDVEIDVFDYHGDIRVHEACSVLFSETTRYGFNPLVLNPDPHYGGVRRAITDVIDAMNSTSRQLGPNQESVLRHLLTDTYMMKGIYADNPRTWERREASEGEVRALTDARDWSALKDVYPSLNDVLSLAKRKLRALWMGLDDKEGGRAVLNAFDDYCRTMAGINQLRSRIAKCSNSESDEAKRMEKRLESGKSKALETHANYINNMQSGREFDEAMKYHSKDVLLSVITRIENLIAPGIFNSNPPPFADARIRRYVIKPLAQSEDELKMFVRFRLKSILREEMLRGETDRLRRMVIIDESKPFNDESAGNPINRIVNEGRKYGLSILLAGQSPEHFSDDFIRGAGTLLLLNLATADWNDAARKLKVDVKALKHLKPRLTGAVRMLENGQASAFRQVQFA